MNDKSFSVSARFSLVSILTLVVASAISIHAIRHSALLRHRLNAWWYGATYLDDYGVLLQPNPYDCGAAALAMVLQDHHQSVPISVLEGELDTTYQGTSLYNLRQIARKHGLLGLSWWLAPNDLYTVPLPAILLLRGNHFVVLEHVFPGVLQIKDPSIGRIRLKYQSFLTSWSGETLVFDQSWSPTVKQIGSEK